MLFQCVSSSRGRTFSNLTCCFHKARSAKCAPLSQACVALLNHLVGGGLDREWDLKTELANRLKVEHEFKLRCPFHRQVGRPHPCQDCDVLVALCLWVEAPSSPAPQLRRRSFGAGRMLHVQAVSARLRTYPLCRTYLYHIASDNHDSASASP
jgi:hypothetical protein